MALRIRLDGRILCAANHREEPGDTYIDDGLHYTLSVEHGVLVTLPMPQHSEPGPRMGQWWWSGNAPSDVDDWQAPNIVHTANLLDTLEK